MDDIARPLAFSFKVRFAGAAEAEAVAFQEVAGLEEGDNAMEAAREGGTNRFVHRLPASVKYQNLVLKRGVVPRDGGLAAWCRTVLETRSSAAVTPKDVVVSLHDGTGDPLRTWSIGNAYPVRWSVSSLDATKDEIAVETIELAFQTVTLST